MTSTRSASATDLPSAYPSLARSMPRRGFLAGLATLPLIGGSIALIGKPLGVAERVTPDVLEGYKTWLEYERRLLSWEMAAEPYAAVRYPQATTRSERYRQIDRSHAFIGNAGSFHMGDVSQPSTRAALVLSAVGCDWREEA